ncbi:MAG: hypothetical protein AAFX87_15950 [Bacteroidota bacterium]
MKSKKLKTPVLRLVQIACIITLATFYGCNNNDDDFGPNGNANVRIVEVSPDIDQYTLTNFGDAAIDISNYRLCSRFTYLNSLSSITVVSGSLDLQPGASVTLSGWPINDTDADFGLYLASGDFGDPTALVDFMQYGSAGNGRESVAVQKGIWTAGDFVDGDSPFSYIGDGNQNGVNFWEGDVSAGGTANVRILEVDPIADEFTFKNFGDATIDISDFRLCSKFDYTPDLSSLTIESGSLTLAPDAEVTISGWTIDDVSADLGLFTAGTTNADFGNPDMMVDFMQYGSAGNGRESVANTKGIWTAGDFIDGGAPFEYTGNGTQNGLTFWDAQASTQTSNLRIVSVDPVNNEFTFRNFGDLAVDISDYRLCSKFTYTSDLTSLTLESGSLNVDPDASVTLSGFDIDNASADFGIFLPGSSNADFGQASMMVDFIQYGSAGNGREGVANTAGIWTAGDFVEGGAPFNYTGNGDDNGLNFWEGTDPQSNIRFVMVDPVTDQYIIKNFDSETVDISGYRLCSEFTYTSNLTSLTIEMGSLNLAPGETVTLSGFDIAETGGADFALYESAGGFDDPNAMVDFMQFGSANNGRESQAVTKGIWGTGEFVDADGPFFYDGNGDENGESFWDGTAANTAIIRVIMVDPATDRVVLKNFGNDAQDISTYWFCSLFDYDQVTSFTLIEGSLDLASGATVTLQDADGLNDATSDVSFYNTNAFGSAAALEDFMQYGASGSGRQGVANTKGIWTLNEVISGTGPFIYTGNGLQQGESFWK